MIQRKNTAQSCYEEPRLITCGSSSLSDAERNYATIELELIAVWWAVDKSSFYLQGIPSFTAVKDHKPLVGLTSHRRTSMHHMKHLQQFSTGLRRDDDMPPMHN
eukprot:snap_masked-scaffold117_size339417-processed-gene-0.0 protein:Tk06382 transcript:snap_masked-scaffold117_size339417-processed-gene-0.0-mRNA-1 annotation:"PREDICTED: uncharacterized protein K02A2.6-like"